jgi:hypothetical protein
VGRVLDVLDETVGGQEVGGPLHALAGQASLTGDGRHQLRCADGPQDLSPGARLADPAGEPVALAEQVAVHAKTSCISSVRASAAGVLLIRRLLS